jgi:hypothetical protein
LTWGFVVGGGIAPGSCADICAKPSAAPCVASQRGISI